MLFFIVLIIVVVFVFFVLVFVLIMFVMLASIFALFLFFCWATWTTRLKGYPVSRLLEFDPLVMISTMLSTGHVYRYLGWGLLIIGVTLLFGRVFCNWICPYGTLHQFVGWLFNIFRGKQTFARNAYRDIYYLPHVGPQWQVEIPEGHYVMLGDNTLDSADSREWRSL